MRMIVSGRAKFMKSRIYAEIVFKGVLSSESKPCKNLQESEIREIFLEMFDSCTNRKR